MTGEVGQQTNVATPCGCLAAPGDTLLTLKELGLDSRLAEASILVCRVCGRRWLRYFYEVEAFTGSGRWYLGHVTPEQASALTAEGAKGALEGLDWYYYGGSYFGGRSGRTAGEVLLNP